MDDIKASNIKKSYKYKLVEWVDKTYGDPGIGRLKANNGKLHPYLGMMLDFTLKVEVKIYMQD